MGREGVELRLRLLEYVADSETPGFFQIAKGLDLHSDDLARELKVLMDQGCLVAYEGGYYSLTQKGLRELDELRGSHE